MYVADDPDDFHRFNVHTTDQKPLANGVLTGRIAGPETPS